MVWHIMDLLIKQRIPTELNSPDTIDSDVTYQVIPDGYVGNYYNGYSYVYNSYGNSPDLSGNIRSGGVYHVYPNGDMIFNDQNISYGI